jgi:hypothetical protein
MTPRDPSDPPKPKPPGARGLLALFSLPQEERDALIRRVEQREQLDEFQPEGKPN